MNNKAEDKYSSSEQPGGGGKGFTSLTSTAVPLPVENVDTDQIIPARFLKAVTREGFGKKLFNDWRYDEKGNSKNDFILNNSQYAGKILVAGKNFGCGSSREHAAWALYDYGFRVVVSSFFADIFRNNALNNSLLPVQVNDGFLSAIFSSIKKNPAQTFSVDLASQKISIDGANLSEQFDINSYRKTCLLNGFDTVDFLVNMKNEIKTYEEKSKFKQLTN